MEPYVLHAGEGRVYEWHGYVNVVKASQSETDGRLALIETIANPGEDPPEHVHEDEDEMFFVLDGTVDFWCGGERLEARPGSFVFLPRQLPHSYTVTSDGPTRLLILTSPSHFGARIERDGHRLR